MHVVCIGTGTAVPDPAHVGAGFWVEAGAARVLLDCGPGVVHGLAGQDLPWQTLTHLALSHFHTDHVGDVAYLLFALRWGTLPPRSTPLTVAGPRGTKAWLERLGAAFGESVKQPDYGLEVVELGEAGALELPGGARLRSCVTPHTKASLGFRIEAGGSALGYTSDTGESDDVARFMRGVDLLVAECSLPDTAAMDSHLTPARLARMARVAAPGRLVVTHVYPQLERAAVPQLVRDGGYEGRVELGEDGARYDAGS